jgi:hypothetical protein
MTDGALSGEPSVLDAAGIFRDGGLLEGSRPFFRLKERSIFDPLRLHHDATLEAFGRIGMLRSYGGIWIATQGEYD